jgi:IS4 transposase
MSGKTIRNRSASLHNPVVLVSGMTQAEVALVYSLYLYRWTIEVLFHWLKYVLTVDNRVSHTLTGLMMQVITILLTYALLILYHQNSSLSLKQMMRGLRYIIHIILCII